MPNLKLPIIGAALLIFTLSMDEIAVSFFLIGRDNTLPLEIWDGCGGASRRKSSRLDNHFCVFAGGNRVLVPLARARRKRRARGEQSECKSKRLHQVCGGGAVTADVRLIFRWWRRRPGLAEESAADVDGEDNRICHQVRDKGSSFFAGPPASARHDVVIVGGGVSGLAAAYRLQHRDFLLLEKEPHWGGNAYAMEYEGSIYATGSAFLAKDEYAYRFAKEIGLNMLPVNSPDASIIRGELILDTWGDGLEQAALSSGGSREL